VVAIGTAVALSGCGSDAEGGSEGSLTLGFVNGDNSGFSSCLQKSVERTAKARGVELFVSNSQMDPAKELSDIENMITRGVDALIVQTVNVDALEGDIAKAKSAKVPIFLTSVATDDVGAVLGAAVVDLPRLGALDAEWVAKDAAGRPVEVGVIAGAPGAASDLMVGGFVDALPANAKVVANQPGMFNPVKAQDVAENMIQGHPDLDYVFVANEEMAFAARKVFDAAGARDIRIVTENGTDEGLAAVADGRFSATVANSPRVIGETAVNNTVALLADPTSAAKIADIPLSLITKENLDQAPSYCS